MSISRSYCASRVRLVVRGEQLVRARIARLALEPEPGKSAAKSIRQSAISLEIDLPKGGGPTRESGVAETAGPPCRR
jgi:hypothetical protein